MEAGQLGRKRNKGLPSPLFNTTVGFPHGRLPVHDSIGLHDQIGEVGRRHEPTVLGCEVFLSDPTGQAARASKVDRHLMFYDLIHQLLK